MNSGVKMLVNFLGIGVQKSASTWVYSILEDHPEADVSHPKELHFFSHESNFKKGVSWYHSHFGISIKNQDLVKVRGEISPPYFYHVLSAHRIKKYNPNVKIIVTLRDPIDRAYSNHLHEIRLNNFEGTDLSFEEGMSQFPMYFEQSRYFTLLKPWYDLFPKENILVLIQEDIQTNPSDSAKKVYEFLGIQVDFVSENLNKRANESRSVKFPLLEGVFRTSAKIANKFGLGHFVSSVKKINFIRKIRDGGGHMSENIPKMSNETEQILSDLLIDEMLNLQKLLELDSLPWKTWRYAQEKKI